VWAREGVGRRRTRANTVITENIYQAAKIRHRWHHVVCSPEHILSVPEGDPSKLSNGRVRDPRRQANPSVPVPAHVGSKTQNVRVPSRPSRPSTRLKRGRVQALIALARKRSKGAQMPEEREKDNTGSPEHEMWTRYSINHSVQSPWTQCEEGDRRDKNFKFATKLGQRERYR
jgi:hypothetical protein